MPQLTAARALSAYSARRFIRFATRGALFVGGLLFLVCWLLAAQLSAWWWLLYLPVGLLMALFLGMRLLLLRVVRQVYSKPFTVEQVRLLSAIVSKILRLVEARGTPLPIFVLLCLKDLFFYRDLRSLREIIDDSVNLSADYRRLETLF